MSFPDNTVQTTAYPGSGGTWSFGATAMSFPDNTVQTTAYAPKYKVYTALLTQTGTSSVQNISTGDLTVGVTYYINNNVMGNFTNVGAPNNDNGTYFVATGTTPADWGINLSGDTLTFDTGAPTAIVLENTIGNVYWSYNSTGVYAGTIDEDLVTEGKQLVFSPTVAISTSDNRYFVATVNIPVDGIVGIYNTDGTDFINGGLENFTIEIRVYN